MVYSIPADPEVDRMGLLDTIPDLAKQAISGPYDVKVTKSW